MKVSALWIDEIKAFIRIFPPNHDISHVYLLQSKTAKQYSAYRLILKDLKIVEQIIQTLKNYENDKLLPIYKQSLSFYAIVTYGKCFTEAKGRGVKLNKRDALKYAIKEQVIEHDRLIDQRNNYVAHGGINGYEHNPVVASLNPVTIDKKIISIYDNIMALVDIDSQLHNMEGLVSALIKYVMEKCDSLFTKLSEDLTKEDIDFLYENSIDIREYKKETIYTDRK